MKRFGFISTAVLFLFLGLTASVFAQQEDRDKPAAEPAAQEGQAAPPDEKREPAAKPAHENEKQTQQGDKQSQEQSKDAKDTEKRDQKDDKQAQEQEKQQPKDLKHASQDNKDNAQAKPDAHQAAGTSGGRIPDDKFRSHFGQQHHFRISHPTVVSGQPRFQNGGYWFVIADPWPVGWDYADDCYIDYVDGEYLLYDLAHPGVTIVVSVVL